MAAAIRCGVVCRDCSGGQCRSLDPKRLDCEECGGKGCPACDNRGWYYSTGCPQKIARPMWRVVSLIDMAEKGHLPVSGGVLDQSAWFIEAYRFYEQQKAKALG